MKNIFLKSFVKIAQKFIPKHKKQNNILIVSTTALGDTLWATPAIESIRKTFPNIYLAALTSPTGMEVLKNNPHLNRCFLLEQPLLHRFVPLWKQLYRERFDTVLIFHASQRLTLPLCSLIGATKIIGTSGINKGLDELLTDPLPSLPQHEIVRRLKIVEVIGVVPSTQKLSFFLQNPLPKRKNGPWIVFHPGSKDPFKRWPKEKFIELGKKLKNGTSCKIVVTGKEKELIDEVAAKIPNALAEYPQTLNEFAQLLNQTDLLVSNDTGPVHLASALNKPVIAIYASTDPFLCGPHKAESAVAISRRASCNPCLKKRCRNPFCFLQIGINEVYDQIIKILDQ